MPCHFKCNIVHALALDLDLAKLTCAVLYSTHVAREVAWHLSATVVHPENAIINIISILCTNLYFALFTPYNPWIVKVNSEL